VVKRGSEQGERYASVRAKRHVLAPRLCPLPASIASCSLAAERRRDGPDRAHPPVSAVRAHAGLL